MKLLALTALSLPIFAFSGLSSAAILNGQVDDFQDGTNMGWGDFFGTGTTPVAGVADAGPAGVGDFAADVAFNNRAVALNDDDRWTGDYTAAGVTTLRLDFNNTSNATVNLRIGIAGAGGIQPGGQGDTWVSASQAVAAGTGWNTLFFDISAAGLTSVGSITDVNAALADVIQIRLIDNASDDFRGVTNSGGFAVDNIAAIPEPRIALIDECSARASSFAGVGKTRHPTRYPSTHFCKTRFVCPDPSRPERDYVP